MFQVIKRVRRAVVNIKSSILMIINPRRVLMNKLSLVNKVIMMKRAINKRAIKIHTSHLNMMKLQ